MQQAALASAAVARHLLLRAGAGAVAVALLAMAGDLAQSGSLLPAPPLDPASIHPGWGPTDFDAAMVQSDPALANSSSRVARHQGDWLPLESYARAHAGRYRLTGSYDDLAEAERTIARAIELVPWPAGPALSRASIALSVHKLAVAETALRRLDASVVPAEAGDRMEALSIRCEITFQHGDIRGARQLCFTGTGLGISLRLANIAAKSGNLADAAARIERLIEKPNQSPSTLAALSLQRASVALAAGDWSASGAWVRTANRVFPGYWLNEAFLAQQYALEGNRAEAIRRYRELATRTGNPDVMDALARLLEAEGKHAGAQGWVAVSTAEWQKHMAMLPEATATHYAEHLLAWVNPTIALELARSEYARRPFSTPATNYARALNHAGKPEAARAVTQDTLARGWSTSALWLEHSRALAALRRPSESAYALTRARQLNPRVTDPAQSFVSFDQN